jgi:hypothetical protein
MDMSVDQACGALLELETASDRWWQEKDCITALDPVMPNATPGLMAEAIRQQEIARLRHLLRQLS